MRDLATTTRIRHWLARGAMVVSLGLGAGSASAVPQLQDWGFNVDGTTYCDLGPCDFDFLDPSLDLPPEIDISGFDFVSGLGTLTISFASGTPGARTVGVFLDHTLDDPFGAGPFNEVGSVGGTPSAGQSFEIDEPLLGDIFGNFIAGTLGNSNDLPSGFNDVAMALGWDFALTGAQSAAVTFTVADIMPSGFFLAHSDVDSGETIYFSSALTIVGDGAIDLPAPGIAALTVTAMLGLMVASASGRQRRRRT